MLQIQTSSGNNFLIQWNAASRSCADPPRISYSISRVLTNCASPKPASTSTWSRSVKKLCIALTLFPGVGQKRSNALNTEDSGADTSTLQRSDAFQIRNPQSAIRNSQSNPFTGGLSPEGRQFSASLPRRLQFQNTPDAGWKRRVFRPFAPSRQGIPLSSSA